MALPPQRLEDLLFRATRGVLAEVREEILGLYGPKMYRREDVLRQLDVSAPP